MNEPVTTTSSTVGVPVSVSAAKAEPAKTSATASADPPQKYLLFDIYVPFPLVRQAPC